MMNKLKNIILISIVLILAACGGNSSDEAGTTSVDPNKVYRWKIVSTWPANFPIIQEGIEKFARDVEVMSNGRMIIQVFAGGELVPALGVFDAVTQGSVEMGHGSAYYWAGKIPAAQFFSNIPFGMTFKGMEAWLQHGGGMELWRELYAPFNLTVFTMGNTGVQAGGWFNKKIQNVDDLKGLRIRMPGLGGKVLSKAGANPVLISGGEIYTALERGTIDATEWIGPFHDIRLGLNRAADYYYVPGWHEPGTVLELMINTSQWEELPSDLQKIIESAAEANGKQMYSAMEFHNQEALQEIKQKQNVEILQFPDEVITQLKVVTSETLLEEAEKDADFKRVYNAYKTFSESYNQWAAIADDAYLESIRD
jgi:TRAP-type mannitol/chloroaromatic compound transport system substrate-binding protein